MQLKALLSNTKLDIKTEATDSKKTKQLISIHLIIMKILILEQSIHKIQDWA